MVELINKIPQGVRQTIETLQADGFEAYIVGGCVRDLLRNAEPTDWDVATNAAPEEIQKVFPDSFCDNKFGTVAVRLANASGNIMEIEVTPYRIESKYTDKRHPDSVQWVKNIQDDLSRRDLLLMPSRLATPKKTKQQKQKSLIRSAAKKI